MSRLSSTIEAILYLKGQPLTLAKIAEYAGCDRPSAEEGLIELMTDYAQRDGALEVVETPEGYCLQLREAFQPLLQKLVPLDLGVGALRTLAAIALRGPLTLSDLVELRGSGAYQHVQELVELGFVRKRRKAQQPLVLAPNYRQVLSIFSARVAAPTLQQRLQPFVQCRNSRSLTLRQDRVSTYVLRTTSLPGLR
jgi:condensin subunit ScpB